MNGELERRWRGGIVPFSGQTITIDSEDLTPLTPLRHALLAVVSRLQQRWSDAALLSLDDWHEHDGFITVAKPISWVYLLSTLASDETLLALSHGDWAVRMSFFPKTYDFYLRVYVPADYDSDYPERRGDFDITCASELAAELADNAALASGLSFANRGAKNFFDPRYSG